MTDTAGHRQGAITRARATLDDGSFMAALQRRVAFRTESQLLPASLPALHDYLENEMRPAFEAMGFTCHIFDNPIADQAPVLLATRIEDERLPTVLGYGHGDVIRGQEEQWTKGAGPWVLGFDGDRVYGRGTADNKVQHSINMTALAAVMAERGGRLGFNAKFMIEMGEEAGSKGLRELAAANRDVFAADVLIASDGPRVRPDRPTLALGCRGAVNFDLVCDLRDGGHHSGNWGGVLANPGIILSHAIASFITADGQMLIPEWRAPPMSNAVRAALADVTVDPGADGPALDPWWGEPGLSPPEKLYAANSFNVLAYGTGTPGRPVNAVPPKAVAHCQLRYVAGTDVARVLPALREHLDRHGFGRVRIDPPPASNDGGFAACQTSPDDPWVERVKASVALTAGIAPAVIPSMGGSICNDVFREVLDMPAIWIPHSYTACSQHAPDEHILLPITRSALEVMAGLYWDIGSGPAVVSQN